MTQLYIGNLPDYCSEDFLQHRFNKHGKIKEVCFSRVKSQDRISLFNYKIFLNGLRSSPDLTEG